MKINVTQADIENGHRADCFHCPIALAVIRATGIFSTVDSDGIRIYDNPVKRFPHDMQRQEFIERYDHKETVEPFSFEIEFEIEV